jgi:hypothetical protein
MDHWRVGHRDSWWFVLEEQKEQKIMPTYDIDFTGSTPEQLDAELAAIGGTGATSGANSGTGAGQTPANPATPWLALAGQTLQASATVIASAINSANETERERIRALAQNRQAEIISDMRQALASNPNSPEVQQLRLQALALQQTITALQTPRQSNTLLYVAVGGVGLLAVAAIVYVAMSGKRRNPRKKRRQ